MSVQRAVRIFKSIGNGSSKTRLDQMQYEFAEISVMDVCSTSDNEDMKIKAVCDQPGDKGTLGMLN